MRPEISFITGFIIGLLGAVHCVGMCSGIVALLTRLASDRPRPRLFPAFLVYYNLGRLFSYVVAGLFAGALGTQLLNVLPVEHGARISQMLTSGFLIAIGLYLTGWWRGLTRLEALGNMLWVRLEPFGRKFLPVKTPMQALAVGAVWGWLPCGLVYSALVWSLVSGSAWQGAAFMMAFGVGTLPALLLMGAGSQWLAKFTQNKNIRTTIGAFMIIFGSLLFTNVIQLHQFHSH